MLGVTEGCQVEAVLARKPARRAGRYCICLSRVLTEAVSWARLRLARLARERLRCDPHLLDRVEFVRVRGEPVDGQPVPGRDQLGHHADVGIHLVPHDYDRPAEVLVRGIQEPGIVRFGEAFALVGGCLRRLWTR
jgi:hypothetical protein